MDKRVGVVATLDRATRVGFSEEVALELTETRMRRSQLPEGPRGGNLSVLRDGPGESEGGVWGGERLSLMAALKSLDLSRFAWKSLVSKDEAGSRIMATRGPRQSGPKPVL